MFAQFQPASNLKQLLVLQELKGLLSRLDLVWYPKTTNRKRLPSYALTSDQISFTLREQLDFWSDFVTDPNSYTGQDDKPIGLETMMMRLSHIYRALGYFSNILGNPADQLTLYNLVVFAPNKQALRRAKSYEERQQIEANLEIAAEETLKLAGSYLRWQQKDRQNDPGTEVLILEAWISAAKALHYEETNPLVAENYRDIPVINALRKKLNQAKERAKNAPPVVDESLKWLNWPEFLSFVQHLEQECHPRYKGGTRRSKKSIAASIQRYLIAGLLAYMPPDRQRTLRELMPGKTLKKGILRHEGNKTRIEERDDGNWFIHLGKGDYKTSETYGEQFHMIPDILYPYLESWINEWRATFKPQHSYLFTQQNGKPFATASSFLSVFKRAAFRITGKAVTPHMVRHMIITYLKRQHASDAVMDSLSAAMHHSRKAQQEDYDRRSSYEQGVCAEHVLVNLAMGKPLSNHLIGRPITVEALLEDIRKLSQSEQQQLLQRLMAS